MKVVLTLMMVCILISSCNLFKKVTKEKAEHRLSYEMDKVSGSKANLSDQTTENFIQEAAVKTLSVSSKYVKADKVKMNMDGSIEAEGNVELHGYQQELSDSIAKAEFLHQSNLKYASEADEKLNLQHMEVDKESKSVSSPSGKAIILGAVAVLVIVFGIMWWFGIGKR